VIQTPETNQGGQGAGAKVLDAGGFVRAHIKCKKCGYDLYGLNAGANCSECDVPVLASVVVHLEKGSVADAAWVRLVVVGTYLVVVGIVIRMLGCCGGAGGPTEPETYLKTGVMYGAISCLGWVLVMRGRPEEDGRLGLFKVRVAALVAALLGDVAASMSIYWMLLNSTYGDVMTLSIPVLAVTALWLIRRYWVALMEPQGWPHRKNWDGLCVAFAVLMGLFFLGGLVDLCSGPKPTDTLVMIRQLLVGLGMLGGGFAYMCVVFDLGLLAKHLAKKG
jgi:ribosomal protein L37E